MNRVVDVRVAQRRTAAGVLRNVLLRGAAASSALLVPLVAAAQGHEDEHNIPLDPQAARFQLATYGVVAILVVGVIAWYWIRRWSITHSGRAGTGAYRDDED